MLVAQDVSVPGLIEQELLDAENCALFVGKVILDALVAEDYELTARDE